MSIKETLRQNLSESMKSKDGVRTNAIRNILSGFTDHEKQKSGNVVTDDIAISLLSNFAKKRRESIDLYLQGGRPELAEAEQKELDVIMEYLPKQASDDEIKNIIEKIILENGLERHKKNLGHIMSIAIPTLKGKADGNNIKRITIDVLSC